MLQSVARCSLIGCGSVLLLIAPVSLAQSAPHEAQAHNAPPIDPPFTFESLDHWREYVMPDAEESKWCDIPWRQSFGEAVKDSQIEGKPILLWAMNGHPMGCT